MGRGPYRFYYIVYFAVILVIEQVAQIIMEFF